MKEAYVQSIISVPDSLKEPLIALLAEIGYEAFEERPSEVHAYIPARDWQESLFWEHLAILPGSPFKAVHERLPAKNWNAEWESNYPSVFVDTYCQIIPSFREPEPGYAHTVIIDPKMSFGTGHHETTRLMIRQMMDQEFEGRSVLDMGCGTGVLGILAAKLGATEVLGIDIDPWSYENGLENLQLNQINQMNLLQGDASVIPDRKYAYIFANINRNVLLADIPAYTRHLAPEGRLVLSGFLLSDATAIETCCQHAELLPVRHLAEGEWLSIMCETKTIEP